MQNLQCKQAIWPNLTQSSPNVIFPSNSYILHRYQAVFPHTFVLCFELFLFHILFHWQGKKSAEFHAGFIGRCMIFIVSPQQAESAFVLLNAFLLCLPRTELFFLASCLAKKILTVSKSENEGFKWYLKHMFLYISHQPWMGVREFFTEH